MHNITSSYTPMDKYLFQYCQKIVVYSEDEASVLLCKRKGEADYDGDFSFIGGKMELSDKDFVAGLRREKNEEVGPDCKVKVFTDFVTNVIFTKKDGNTMILPHFYAVYQSGEIDLNEEYSEFRWVALEEIVSFEPKIPTIPGVLEKFDILKETIQKTSYVII